MGINSDSRAARAPSDSPTRGAANGYPVTNGHALPNGYHDPTVVVVSSRVVLDDRITEATIVSSQATGKITAIFHSVLPPSDFPPGTQYVDYSPHVIIPGIVDAHVHLNEPGRTEWEGFWTGTRAAAFGGVTTVVDMPLNAIPPTTTVAGFEEKIRAAEGKCWVDVGFYGGIIPGNQGELKDLVRMGVRGFKGFLIDSGVEEFPAVSSTDIRHAMAELADEPTTLMFHAEMIPPISDSVGDEVQASLPPLSPKGPLDAYSTFLASRPPAFETYAIAEILSLAHLAPKLPLHIVHLSTLQAIPLLREARAAGVKVTAETCFHYLSLTAEQIAAGDTRHKCCPPIRERANQDALWAELLSEGEGDSVIKTVVSDHSPCTPNLKLLPAAIPGSCASTATSSSTTKPKIKPNNAATKTSEESEGDFFAAWGGISSVGLGLPILWTEAYQKRRPVSLPQILQWCSTATASQVGLSHLKGALKKGLDADFAVFDDQAEWVLGRESLLFRNACSPYQGKRLRGMVRATWVRGWKVFERLETDEGGYVFAKEGPRGRLLLEPRTF